MGFIDESLAFVKKTSTAVKPDSSNITKPKLPVTKTPTATTIKSTPSVLPPAKPTSSFIDESLNFAKTKQNPTAAKQESTKQTGVDPALYEQLRNRGVKPETIASLAPDAGSINVAKNFKENLLAVPKGIVGMFTNPSENIKKTEQIYGYSPTTQPTDTLGKVEKYATLPIRTIGKGFTRLFGAMVEPVATDIGEIVAVNEISGKVAKGELPATALDDISVLHKTIPQITGDVAQAVLAIYGPKFVGKNILGNGVVTGALEGLGGGATFGVAQAASSGSKNPSEIIQTIAGNALGGMFLGGVTGGVHAKVEDMFGKIDKVKSEVSNPEVKTVLDNLEKELVTQVAKKADIPVFSKEKLANEMAADQTKIISDFKNELFPPQKLLPEPKGPAETQGVGFVMSDKVSKEKLVVAKADARYREAVQKFTQKPTPKTLLDVLKLKEERSLGNKSAGPKQFTNFIDESVNFVNKKTSLPKEPPATEPVPTLPPQADFTAVPEAKPIQTSSEVPSLPPEPLKPVEPVVGGKVSKVARSIEAKTVEKGLAQSFEGLAEYTPIVIKEQAKMAADLINNDFARARRIINGQEVLPQGMRGGTLIKALEDYALMHGDTQLAMDIANSHLTSETSVHAQEMRTLAERNPDSAVAKIKEIKKARTENASKNAPEKTKIVSEIKKSMDKIKPTKETWSSFIDSIKC